MDAVRRPIHCRTAPGCLDYRKFAFDLDKHLSDKDYEALNRALPSLGQVRSEHLGIRRIGGDWGFLITPPPGFPELSVSFYRNVDEQRISDILGRIGALIAQHANAPAAASAAARRRRISDTPRQ